MTQEMSTTDYHALVSEKVFTEQVIAEAKAHGWLAIHQYDSRRSEPGFPDIVAANAEFGMVIYAELKTVKASKRKNRGLSDAQLEWMWTLEATGDFVYVWTPNDWDEIRAVLRGD